MRCFGTECRCQSRFDYQLDGPPPRDEKGCVFLALDTATASVAEFPPTDAGKTARYRSRIFLLKYLHHAIHIRFYCPEDTPNSG